MDAKNLFMTRNTYWLVRAEYGLGLLVAVGLFFRHLGQIQWPAAIGLFLYIDLIGYIPGAIAYHRSKTKQLSKAYYVLYNLMHSMVTQGLVALAWTWLWGAQWTLLVLVIHLFGDRALFGNFIKPFGLHFEPQADPAYRRFSSEFAAASHQGHPVGPLSTTSSS
ncbi:hypothetical protein P3T37_001208 [Kitasatospora sp. MAA4]|uniref:hypothetical protein n=1 Tax=Kitasatospora sp. MAA4 TaxID=3035093 RepID=UPI002473877F|nr:hypothetical protein [Kitasatospora sp. MAA4]MDH6131834.1 hypothetical protein [Kitasatospora sp. MAA4]